jgi:hypothetical protein
MAKLELRRGFESKTGEQTTDEAMTLPSVFCKPLQNVAFQSERSQGPAWRDRVRGHGHRVREAVMRQLKGVGGTSINVNSIARAASVIYRRLLSRRERQWKARRGPARGRCPTEPPAPTVPTQSNSKPDEKNLRSDRFPDFEVEVRA